MAETFEELLGRIRRFGKPKPIILPKPTIWVPTSALVERKEGKWYPG